MRYFSCLIVSMLATAALADPPGWLNDDEITKAFSGVTLAGVYADGRDFTEAYARDRTLSYTDHRGKLAGRWSAINGSFCTLYDSFITGGCFRVTRHSGNCYEFYFSSSTEQEAASDEPKRASWTARGWDKAMPATCDDKPSA